ncbi:fungal-specific transcription factor domain-containing protein [Lineolata rhizophorae]|uniref:Fungal-specific transcription factor domain-containing protein n=1 Tax=Lineolata rhizophorae TaxID=578093 RepID=A0A6A6P3U8_9PEZI|nr:fungal-specific transcription factor domain-containing protein [Lineolata rhizophorae]
MASALVQSHDHQLRVPTAPASVGPILRKTTRLRQLPPPNLSTSSEQQKVPKRTPKRRPASQESEIAVRCAKSPARRAQSIMQAPRSLAGGASGVTYTKTGRISKAKKGLKVHKCEVRGCNKVFSRAEHLRRHAQNHAPKGLPCEHPGCGKAFARPDLLKRHRERHETEDMSPRRSSCNSNTSTSSSDAFTGPIGSVSSMVDAPIDHSVAPSAQFQPSYDVFAEPVSITSAPKPTYSLSLEDNLDPSLTGPPDGRSSHRSDSFQDNQWNDERRLSSYASSESPAQNSFGIQLSVPSFPPGERTRSPSSSSAPDSWYPYPIATSRTPASPMSPITPYYWPPNTSGPELSLSHPVDLPFATSTTFSLSSPLDAHLNIDASPFPCPTSYADIDSAELVGLMGAAQSLMDGRSHNARQYFNLYWEHFHHLLPILHKPTITSEVPPPLLRAAMMVIGAQYSEDRSAKETVRPLHDACVKMIGMRDKASSRPLRTCDKQATLLVEYYSQFRGKRATRGLSKAFVDVYTSLLQDDEVTSPHTLDTLEDPAQGEHRWQEWVEIATKHRLFQACITLDCQQSALLGRVRPMPDIDFLNLPLSSSAALWEASSLEQWISLKSQTGGRPSTVSDAYEAFSSHHIPSHYTLDAFQSRFLISALYFAGVADQKLVFWPYSQVIDESSCVQLPYHAAMLARNTPIRSLLGVTGESWIPSERLARDKYTEAKLELRVWVEEAANRSFFLANDLIQASMTVDGRSVRIAARHALCLLRIAMDQPPEQSDLVDDYAVYEAVLVLWAITYVGLGRHARARPQVTNNAAAGFGAVNFEGPPGAVARDTVLTFLRRAELLLDRPVRDGSPRWPDTASVLIEWRRGVDAALRWVRLRLCGNERKTLGELMNGSVRVLEELIARGWAEGWF